MPSQITNFQCPSCTGPLHFDSATGRVVCDYCGSSYDVAQIEALYAEKNKKAETAFNAKEEKGSGDAADTDADYRERQNISHCGQHILLPDIDVRQQHNRKQQPHHAHIDPLLRTAWRLV